MTEWQIIESDNLPETPAETQAPLTTPLQRPWGLLWIGVILFLVVIGFFTLRQQRSENRAVLQDDLAAYIFEEESARYLGQPDRLAYAADAPLAWQQAYLKTFEIDQTNSPPPPIQITELDFDSKCAVVTVELVNTRQVRAYCLDESDSWRRAPVPAEAWRENQDSLRLENGVEIHFFGPDRAFAEALARELPPVFETLAQYRLWPGALPGSDQAARLEIKIVPQDLHPPLILAEGNRIILNSPWLTPAQPATGLAGEAAVRLALGEALLRPTAPTETNMTNLLPGFARFMAAGQTVLAMHLLLAPDIQISLLDHWRAQREPGWLSPFFVGILSGGNAGFDDRAEATARITAHYIYALKGPEGLFSIIQQLPRTSSWDRLFRAVLGRPLFIVEREAALYARTGNVVESQAVTLDDLLPIPKVPFTATFLYPAEPATTGARAYVKLSDRIGSVLVDIPAGLTPRTRDGLPAPLRCLGFESKLEIDGEWLELHRRLQATEITIQDISPLRIRPAPPDTIAYLFSGETYDPRALVTLSRTGNLQFLAPLSSAIQVFTLPMAAEEKPHFLFRFEAAWCGQTWFIHYEPTQGIVRQWLAPPGLSQWVWQADKQGLVFFNTDKQRSRDDIYQTNDTFLPELKGRSNMPQTLLGWNIRSGRLVSHISQPERYQLGLFDIASGDVLDRPYYLLLRGRALSPDGEWLAYLVSSLNSTMPPNRLEVLNLTDESAQALIVTRLDEAFWPPVWSPYLARPMLAALAGSTVDNNELPPPTRLFIAWPDRPNEFQIVAEAAPGEQFASPVFCTDGALLYLVQANGEYRLQRQIPGQPAQIVGRFERPLYPLACP